jgi:transcriptional regulator with XRE-family HTH domain
MKKSSYIRALLDSKDISVAEMAKKIGISASTLNNKISEKIRFNEHDIDIICDTLEMTYEEIFKPNKVTLIDKSMCDSVITIPGDQSYKVPTKETKKFLESLKNKIKIKGE